MVLKLLFESSTVLFQEEETVLRVTRDFYWIFLMQGNLAEILASVYLENRAHLCLMNLFFAGML